jgi:hypothetical protein
MFSVLGSQDYESFEEFFVDENVEDESCKRVEVVTLETEIIVSPQLKMTATESNSNSILDVPETCPINLSVLQDTAVQKPTPHARLDDSRCTRPERSVFNFIASMRMEQANHLLALSSSTSVNGKMSKPVTKVVNKSLKKTYFKTT